MKMLISGRTYDQRARVRGYQPGWEREFAWLRQNDDKTAMICTACRERLARTRSKQDAAAPFVKGCSNFRREALTKHLKSEVHMRAVGAQAAHTAEARFYCLFIY